MKGLVQHWGLWFGARGPFEEACQKFSDIYRTAAEEMNRNAEALTSTADDYDKQEEQGAKLADQIAR